MTGLVIKADGARQLRAYEGDRQVGYAIGFNDTTTATGQSDWIIRVPGHNPIRVRTHDARVAETHLRTAYALRDSGYGPP